MKLQIVTKKSIYLILFSTITILTLIIGLIKTSAKENPDIYVKVHVSQGLWWANTNTPPLWLTQKITPGDTELNLFGETTAEIISVRKYPEIKNDYIITNKFNTYLTIKLQASHNKNTNKYTYNRNDLVIGSPIELNLQNTTVSGAVMDISPHPFEDSLESLSTSLLCDQDDTISSSFLWNRINIGDQYHDGNEVVFEIINKNLFPIYRDPIDSNIYFKGSNVLRKFSVEAVIKTRRINNSYVFGEDKIISINSPISITLPQYNLLGCTITDISPHSEDK